MMMERSEVLQGYTLYFWGKLPVTRGLLSSFLMAWSLGAQRTQFPLKGLQIVWFRPYSLIKE